MPIVIKPQNGAHQSKLDKVFQWDMQGVPHVQSQVVVGSYPGGLNYYNGGNGFPNGTTEDRNVNHPGGSKLCFTRPRYQKTQGGAWYTDGSTITNFTSDN